MVALHEKYHEQGLEILAFPCNQFGGQEPGTPEQIRAFVDGYGVKFQMFEKIEVNGENAHPLFKFLCKEKKGILGTEGIKWNFTKFIINRNGEVVERLGPQVGLFSYEEKLKALLAEKFEETSLS